MGSCERTKGISELSGLLKSLLLLANHESGQEDNAIAADSPFLPSPPPPFRKHTFRPHPAVLLSPPSQVYRGPSSLQAAEQGRATAIERRRWLEEGRWERRRRYGGLSGGRMKSRLRRWDPVRERC
jgi:hypothetical protein